MKIHNYILPVTIALMLSSCDDFLDKQPSVSDDTPVTESSQLMAVYDDYVTNIYSANFFAFYSTDDTELPKGVYLDSPSSFDLNYNVSFYCHFRQGIIDNSNDRFWTGEYAKIYNANLIIESASSVTGSQAEINEALGCAHFMRAYSFFDLATYYCLPWCEAHKGALGIPLRLGLDFTEDVSRGTLEQTYNQIFADLQAAEQYITRDAVDADKPWRVSKCAINALYSRIYLARGEYSKALDYTNAALANAPELFDYNDFGWGRSTEYSKPDDLPVQTLEYCETNDWGVSKFLYFKEWIFPRLIENRNQWDLPSSALIALYNQENDLRFDFFFVEHGNRRWNVKYDWWSYSQFNSGRYVIGGLTIQELLLNKAELMVRTGDWQNALAVLDPLRQTRFRAGTATSLTATSQSEALKQVLDERRRELPFTFRMGDIKRFSVNETAEDDVTIVRDFFEVNRLSVDTSTEKTWTIPGNSPMLAMPIYQTEIDSSHGIIEQNPGE